MQEVRRHTDLDRCVLRALVYFDIFSYPLKAAEVYQFLGRNHVTQDDVTNALNALIDDNDVYRFGEFYSIRNEESVARRRSRGNAEARRLLPQAERVAMRIARFPFVRAVMGSGSLSKGYMDENSDFDFFIVTESGRLWICRMLLALYKRVFLGNSHKFFCANYFIDTSHLEIDEKNLFTATELVTVIPFYGKEYYHQLMNRNRDWVTRLLPNSKTRDTEKVPSHSNGRVKRIMEAIINFVCGAWCERLIMAAALRRWNRKYFGHYAAEDFKVAFKSTKHVSKNHPRNFQQKVMDLYHERLQTLRQKV